ncbi:MAG: gliding motility lipoprotein GldH [Chitinophagales bacterium]
MKKVTIIFTTLLFVLLISSCDDSRIFEENKDFESYAWSYENIVKFETELTDSLANNVIVNFRHTHFFGSRNLLLMLHITTPSGKKTTTKINIPLSEPNGMWYADCTGDICDIQYNVPEFKNYTFSETGKYTFELEQEMRESPLKNVMAVGLRIEKASK